jgi:hypothetical protein
MLTSGGRVAILYGAGKYFACRKCYDLTYRSCQESDKRVSCLLINPAALDGATNNRGTSAMLLALKALYKWDHRQTRHKKRGGNAHIKTRTNGERG